MRSTLLTLAAAGVAGAGAGAGAGADVGVAAAQATGGGTPTPVAATASEFASMEEMHGAMRVQMPAEHTEACDRMHTAMPEGHAPDGIRRDGLDDGC